LEAKIGEAGAALEDVDFSHGCKLPGVFVVFLRLETSGDGNIIRRRIRSRHSVFLRSLAARFACLTLSLRRAWWARQSKLMFTSHSVI
jgi:hypothetical protein